MSQLITLSSGLASSSGALSRLRDSLKLRYRALVNRRATLGWLQLLNSHPLFLDLVKARPRLLYKIYRPYLSSSFDCHQRLALLHSHYRFVFRHGLGPLVVQAARAPVVLGSLAGKSGLPYQLQLRAIEPLEREGELVLQLLQGETLVYSSAFSFFQRDGAMLLGIGCMQGPQGAHGLQVIKDATRELHGLRPKNLMLRLLRQLGHDYGCQQLQLVGNANRALTGSARRKGKVYADYDSLWQEMEAVQHADGDYRLACAALAPPDLAAIASKKRSEARKRHETLEQLAALVRQGLQAPRFAAVTSSTPVVAAAHPAAANHASDYASAVA